MPIRPSHLVGWKTANPTLLRQPSLARHKTPCRITLLPMGVLLQPRFAAGFSSVPRVGRFSAYEVTGPSCHLHSLSEQFVQGDRAGRR